MKRSTSEETLRIESNRTETRTPIHTLEKSRPVYESLQTFQLKEKVPYEPIEEEMKKERYHQNHPMIAQSNISDFNEL